MSWNQWNTGVGNAAPNAQAQVAGSSTPNPNATSSQIPYNPTILPPGNNYASQFSGMTPEQQYAMQQNWQQWQSYQQQYAQWHAQYGEQYKREMEVKLGGAPPSLPFAPSMPTIAANISQYSQIIPPTPSVMYAAPPPPPENEIKKPNDLINDQPPPPPPPPENPNVEDKRYFNKTDMISPQTNNYNRNTYPDNRQLHGNNERETTKSEFENKMKSYQYEQNSDDKKNYKNLDVSPHSNQPIDNNSAQINNKTSEYLPGIDIKSREEKIFDEQFRKWEEEFENWKKANVNHPDKKAYREYEMKFEDCRRKLIERREQMRRKKLQQEQQAKQEQELREQQIKEELEQKLMEQQIREEKIKQLKEEQMRQQLKEEQMRQQLKEEQIRQQLKEEQTRQQLKEEQIRQLKEDQMRQEQQRLQEEELKREQQAAQKVQYLEDQSRESINKMINEPKTGIVIEDIILSEEKQDHGVNNDNIEVKTDFLATCKKDFGIPGLDLVQPELSKQVVEPSNIIDLDKSDECDNARPIIWENLIDKKSSKIEKSRWSTNEGNNEMLQKDWNTNNYERNNENYSKQIEFSGNEIRTIPNKIPSLFDQKIEKPTFSPPHEKPESFGFSKTDDDVGVKLVEGSDNKMQNLANALADPNVMALLSAALQKNEPIPIENKDIIEKERDYTMDEEVDNYNFEMDNPGIRNQFGNRFGGGNTNQFRGNDNYNSNQGNQLSRNSYDGGNRFGGNRSNISIWEQDNRNNNWNQDKDNNSIPPIWNNQQNLMQDSQSHRNPFNALNRGSRGDFNDDIEDSRNIFDNNRGRDREWNNDRNDKNRRRSNNNNNNKPNFGSSNNNDNIFDQNQNSDNKNVNPFRRDFPKISKSPNTNFNQQQRPEEDEYFRPAHVIDYQNKPLTEVANTTQKETDSIPTKIVDYGHKTAAATAATVKHIESENFFPMKTIDYGHATKTDVVEPVKLRQSFGDFLAIRTNNQKRKADDTDEGGEFEKKKKIKIFEYGDKWTLYNNKRPQQTLLSQPATKYEKSKNNKINELNINDCQRMHDKSYLSNYMNNDNLDAVSDVENDFDDESNIIMLTNNYSNDNCTENLDSFKSINTLINIKTSQNLSSNQSSNIIVNEIKNDDESIQSTNNNNKNIVEKKFSENKKCIQMLIPSFENNNTILIDEIILNPGRFSRPKNIVIILRGPPGSGKSFIAKLIKDKEIELNGNAPRLLSIDDYFMIEIDKEENCPKTGRKTIRKELIYEYDNLMEKKYFEYLMKSFKKTLLEQQFNFIIVDCVNHSLRTFTDFYNLSKLSNYTPYTIDLHCNLEKCLKQNIHNRSENDLKDILKNWNNTPDHYIKLDVTNIVSSFQSSNVTDDNPIGEQENEISSVIQSDNSDSHDSYDSRMKTDFMKCKWDVNTTEASLARLDGTRKNFQSKTTLEDYLQMDGWEAPPSNSNKKRVRWADIEEKREQDKMRAIGFVVGHTDWNRMLDPTCGSSALTRTKFIEKLSKKK